MTGTLRPGGESGQAECRQEISQFIAMPADQDTLALTQGCEGIDTDRFGASAKFLKISLSHKHN